MSLNIYHFASYSIDIDFETICYVPVLSTRDPFSSISFTVSRFPMHSLKESRVARRDSTSELLKGQMGAAGIRTSGTASEPRVNVYIRSQHRNGHSE